MANEETAPQIDKRVRPDVAQDVNRMPEKAAEARVTDGAKRAKAQWDKESKGDKHAVTIPGSDAFVQMSKVEVVDNTVYVWTSSDTSLPADFVIVNPPTQVYIDKDTSVENPLGVIAHAIHGATQ
jgi:hypothetical protein